MSTVKAAAVQISPVLYSREGTVDKVVRTIHELGQQGVVQSASQMIAGREHLTLLDQAVTVPSAATDAIGTACKEVGLVASIGDNERDGGTLCNTQLLFDADGMLIQRRRKITPTYHERMVWRQGDGSISGDLFSEQTEVNVRQHALESACGHYSRPELLSLRIDRTPASRVHQRVLQEQPVVDRHAQDLLATVG